MRTISEWVSRIAPKSGLARKVAQVASGAVIGQAAVILASPLLSRLYDPSDFGLFATYFAVVSLLTPAVSMRIPLAIVVPKLDAEAHDIVRLVLVTTLGGVVLLEGLVWLVGPDLLATLNAAGLRGLLWLAPIAAFLGANQESASYWAIRHERFGRVATTRGLMGITKASSQVAMGFVKGISVMGLILGDLVGRVVAIVALWFRGGLSLRRASESSLVTLAKRYKSFALFSGPAAILNSTGRQLTPLLIAAYFGMEVAGWFGLAQRVVAVPLALLGQAIAQVYIGAVGRLAREDPKALLRLYRRISLKLLLIGAVPLGLVAAGGPPLFELVFGPEWGEVGVYVRLLIVMYIIQFVVFPLSQTLNVLERQSWQLAWDAVRVAAIAIAVITTAVNGAGPRATLVAFGSVMAASYLALFVLNWYAIARLKNEPKPDEEAPQ